MNNFKDKFDGCFFGSIVGDALGMPYEFKHPSLITYIPDMIPGGPFNLPKGCWTDDTCKITHKLSGEFVESNTEPYIYNNKLKAFQELFTKLNINQKFLMDFVNQPDIPNFKYAL